MKPLASAAGSFERSPPLYHMLNGLQTGRASIGIATMPTAEALRHGRLQIREKFSIYELCGIRAPVAELYRLWAEHITVSRSTVQRRLTAGVDKYEAFFGAATPNSRRRASPWGLF